MDYYRSDAIDISEQNQIRKILYRYSPCQRKSGHDNLRHCDRGEPQQAPTRGGISTYLSLITVLA